MGGRRALARLGVDRLHSTAGARSTTLLGIDAQEFLLHNGIDAVWLTDRLVEAGQAADTARLKTIRATSIGTGQVGENIRCTLGWADGAGPESVVVKLPSASEVSRATAAATKTYIREVGFYRDVHNRVAIRTPEPYFLSEDVAANSFILVMEDITPAEQGEQLDGCSPERAALAVEAIAHLHGPTWERNELLDLDWLDGPTADSIRDRIELYNMLLPGFVDRYDGVLTSAELDLGRWLGASMRALAEAQLAGPGCLTHGDYRLDNILFGTGPEAPPITTVDWQTVSWGRPLTDVAYFISGALSRPEQAEHHTALLDRYNTQLATYGIELDSDQLRRGYALGSGSGYVMAVIASQIVERTERGDAMFVAMARGSAALADDVGLPDLLD